MDLQNNLGLCTMLFVCYMITISNRRKKSKMGVSADQCVTVEDWGSSSIRVIFIDYQTNKLQYNYQSYIQVHTIGNAWDSSDIAPITLSGDFSVETLIGVWLYHRRLSCIGVFLLQKTESLDCYIITTQTYCKKGGHHRRQAFRLDIDKEYYCRDVLSRWMDLAYNKHTLIAVMQQSGYLLQYESVDRLWTRIRVRTLDNYQSTMDIGLGRHVTWKSCDRVKSGLEELRVQKDREESRRSQGQR